MKSHIMCRMNRLNSLAGYIEVVTLVYLLQGYGIIVMPFKECNYKRNKMLTGLILKF